jgi:hypothetical protein
MEAALGRRLDRLTRQVERLERHSTISNEALALFVRFWLAVTPPLPDTAQPAAQAKGRERYEGFVEALGEGADPGPGDFSRRDFQGQGAGSYRRLFMNGFAVGRSFYARALRSI